MCIFLQLTGLTAPLPQTPKEMIEYLKTQIIHGSMVGYHASFAVLVGSGLGAIVAKIIFQTESSHK